MNHGDHHMPPPGMPAFPFFPNQMVPQPFPTFHPNLAMGDPFNSNPAVPQMMPTMPMFNMNGFHQMPAMPHQMFNPMQFTHPGMNPLMPSSQSMMPMGMMNQMPPMGYVQYVFVPMGMPPGQPAMSHPVQTPFPVPIKNEPLDEDIQCTAVTINVNARPRNSFAINDILGKTEVKSEVIDGQDFSNSMCNSIETKASESIDSPPRFGASIQPDSSLDPHFHPEDIPDTPASPDHQPYAYTDNSYPQTIPEDSVSHHRHHIVPTTSAPSPIPSFGFVGMAENADEVEEEEEEEAQVDSAQSPPPYSHGQLESVDSAESPPPFSHALLEFPSHSPWKQSSRSAERSPLTTLSSTPDRLRIVESNESFTSDKSDNVVEDGEELHLEESIEDIPGSSNEHKAEKAPVGYAVADTRKEEDTVADEKTQSSINSLHEDEIDMLLAEWAEKETTPPLETAVENTPPSIPPRFPQRSDMDMREERRMKMEKEEEQRKEKDRPSPIEWKEEGETSSPSSSFENKNKRVNPYSILMRSVPNHIKRPRIVRYFEDRYDSRCTATRVKGQPYSTVRIEFRSMTDRDRALREAAHTLSRTTLLVFEEVLSGDEDLERREDTKQSVRRDENQLGDTKTDVADGKRHSPIRIPSGQDMGAAGVMDETPPILHCYQARCGQVGQGSVLTAGPIPSGCNLRRVVDYFNSQCTEVLYSPYPCERSREFLILRFTDILKARSVLAAIEHRVDGHAIQVSPAYDVHLKMYNMKEKECIAPLIETMQNECGVVVTIPNIRKKTETFMIGFLSFARPADAQAAIKRRHFQVAEGRCEVIESDGNIFYQPFKDVWLAKCKISTMERQRSMRDNSKTRRVLNDHISDAFIPILTIGPIPDHLLKECDEYLLEHFENVFNVPYPHKTNHYRLLTIRDPVMITALFNEGYIKVGKKQEKILISPSSDVTFHKGDKRYSTMTTEPLVKSMQNKFGPIVRTVQHKKGYHKVTFGRIQDAQRVIFSSPHFKKLQVVAEETRPNTSFAPFVGIVDMHQFYSRAQEAERIEEAANIRINCRNDSESDHQSTSGRRRRHSGESEDEVLLCSPVKKRMKAEDGTRIVVRVNDTESWLPKRSSITDYFSHYGKIQKFIPVDHNEAHIEFGDEREMLNALENARIFLDGHWLDVLKYHHH